MEDPAGWWEMAMVHGQPFAVGALHFIFGRFM